MMGNSQRPASLDPSGWNALWSLSTARAAWWAATALHRVRRDLDVDGVLARVPQPPALPVGASRGVQLALHRVPATCLERAVVLQTWLAAHGERHEVVIGVQRHDRGVSAHAWLDFEDGSPRALGHLEIFRLGAP